LLSRFSLLDLSISTPDSPNTSLTQMLLQVPVIELL
jgi:hypothetical protein